MLVSQWDDDEFKREAFVDLADLPDTAKSEILDKDSSDIAKEPLSPQNKESSQQSEHISKPLTAESSPLPQKNSESQMTGLSPLAETTSKPKITEPAQVMEEISKPQTTESSQVLEKTSNSQALEASDLPDNSLPSKPVKDLPNKDTEDLHAAETNLSKSSAKTMDALKAVEALPLPERRTAGFHTVSRNPHAPQKNPAAQPSADSGHSKSETPEDWHLRWRFILENFPVMTPFSGDENTLCVRLELKDIRQLPRQFWYFGNNSFLLHGFFNYRYIILGMTEEFGVKKWFIGVPGVFQNPERVMAALFGFPEFRSEKPSPINTGQFGYWYRYLNELSQPSEKAPS